VLEMGHLMNVPGLLEELAERLRQVRTAVQIALIESQLMVELERVRLEAASRKRSDGCVMRYPASAQV
jgi:hypothetical protein